MLKIYFDKYKDYISLKSNEVFDRYKFHARVQEGGEPFESFATDLKLLVSVHDLYKIVAGQLGQ